jgi:cell wall-associated NlpC family hydrolase
VCRCQQPTRCRGGWGGVLLLACAVAALLMLAPHAEAYRSRVPEGGRQALAHVIGGLPSLPSPSPFHREPPPAGGAKRAVRYALAQRGKPYRWGAEGPDAYDCSGLTMAAWRHAGVTLPRTAAAQLAHGRRVKGTRKPGDLVIYPSSGPTGRHVAMVTGPGRMVEARGRGIPVRVTRIRPGALGTVRPSGR